MSRVGHNILREVNLMIEEQRRRERERSYYPVHAEIQIEDRPPPSSPKIDYEVRYEI
jgi:hypothetical protein